MNSHAEKAMENFRNGCNCSQAVFLAFEDEIGMDRKTMTMLASSFGGGMGRMREVCGAISAICMIVGLKYGNAEIGNDDKKTEVYELVQTLANKFKEENSTIICRELLGEDGKAITYIPEKRTEKYYEDRPCEKFVGDAARIMSEYMSEHKV